MFHPGVSRNENLTAFISELFRFGGMEMGVVIAAAVVASI